MKWGDITQRNTYDQDYSELLIVDNGTPVTPYRTKVTDILEGVTDDIAAVNDDLAEHINNSLWHPVDFWVSWQRWHIWKGTITWNSGTGQITFSADLKLWLPLSGHRLTIPATSSPVTLSTTRDVWYIAITTYPEIVQEIRNVADTWLGLDLSSNSNMIPVAMRIGSDLYHDFRA